MISLPLIGILDKGSLISHLSWMNLKLRFKGSYLGLIWAGLEPLLMFLILYVVFSSIRTGPKENFGMYLIVGILLYHLFARGTMSGLTSLKENGSILKSMNLPKELFPVIATVTTCLFLFVQLGVLFGLMPIFNFVPGWAIVLLPILLLLFMVLVLGACYLLSILFIYVKDVQPFWGVFLYAAMFTSPIFWYISEVDGILLIIHQFNPLGQIIELAHKLIIFNEFPSLTEWLSTSAIIFGIFFTSFVIFKKLEKNVVEKL